MFVVFISTRKGVEYNDDTQKSYRPEGWCDRTRKNVFHSQRSSFDVSVAFLRVLHLLDKAFSLTLFLQSLERIPSS